MHTSLYSWKAKFIKEQFEIFTYEAMIPSLDIKSSLNFALLWPNSISFCSLLRRSCCSLRLNSSMVALSTAISEKTFKDDQHLVSYKRFKSFHEIFQFITIRKILWTASEFVHILFWYEINFINIKTPYWFLGLTFRQFYPRLHADYQYVGETWNRDKLVSHMGITTSRATSGDEEMTEIRVISGETNLILHMETYQL